jgi:hypothetical protein
MICDKYRRKNTGPQSVQGNKVQGTTFKEQRWLEHKHCPHISG